MMRALTSIALTLVTLALVLLPLIFSGSWYRYNCEYHNRCNNLEPIGVEQHVVNMGNFFLFREDLAASWDQRGREHLHDVRRIYTGLAGLVAVAAAVLFFSLWQDPSRLGPAGRNALLFTLAAVSILPVFGFFWEKVFHPLAFDNDLWRTRPGEVLWNLTPRVFFRNSAIALIVGASLLNLMLWRAGKYLWPAR